MTFNPHTPFEATVKEWNGHYYLVGNDERNEWLESRNFPLNVREKIQIGMKVEMVYGQIIGGYGYIVTKVLEEYTP